MHEEGVEVVVDATSVGVVVVEEQGGSIQISNQVMATIVPALRVDIHKVTMQVRRIEGSPLITIPTTKGIL
jgi:hypothetical protein